MSDYLTTLASRAIGQAPVVKPRLPSRFELGPDGFDQLVLDANDEDAADVPEDAPPRRETLSHDPTRGQSATRPAPLTVHGRDSVRELPSQSGAMGEGYAAERDTARAVQDSPASPSQPERSTAPSEHAPADLDAIVQGASDDSHVPLRSLDAEPRILAPASPPSANRNQMDVEEEATEVEAGVRPVRSRDVAASLDPAESDTRRPSPLVPRATNRLEGRSAAPPSPSSFWDLDRRSAPKQDAERVVKVSIGRIDVRAVTSLAPVQRKPRKPARAGPSLDEYLKRRETGRR